MSDNLINGIPYWLLAGLWFSIGAAVMSLLYSRKFGKTMKQYDAATKRIDTVFERGSDLSNTMQEAMKMAAVDMSDVLNRASQFHHLILNIRIGLAEVIDGRRIGDADAAILQSWVDEIDRQLAGGEQHVARPH